KYRLVAGQGQPTDERVNYQGMTFSGAGQDNAGDGTNPLWTSSPSLLPATILVGGHFGVMNTGDFHDILWTELTGGPSPFILADVARVVISLDQLIYQPGDDISILIIPDKPTSSISAEFEVSKATLETALEFVREKPSPFDY